MNLFVRPDVLMPSSICIRTKKLMNFFFLAHFRNVFHRWTIIFVRNVVFNHC